MAESITAATEQTVADLSVREGVPGRVSLAVWLTNFGAVVLPIVGLGVGIAFLWGRGFSWVELGLLLGMYALTVLGITVGFHRLFTHRAFETNRVVQLILALLGSMAVQGPLLKWVALHRRHHQHSDRPGDPHSPHLGGHGLLGLLRGFWHSHIGWIFRGDAPGLDHYVKDLRQSRLLRVMSALFPLWVVVGLLIPTILGGLLTMSWIGALLGLVWGGLVRVLVVHHMSWSINSICHLWGGRPFRSSDHSRNNFVFGVLAMGEGWHNNHHAFPTSARYGLRWWQIDVGYWCIRALACCGLAWNVSLPSRYLLAYQAACPTPVRSS